MKTRFFPSLSLVTSLAIGITSLGMLSNPARATVLGLGDSTTLANLVAGTDYFEFGNLRFDNFQPIGHLATGGAAVPTSAQITVIGAQLAPDDFALTFQSAIWVVGPGQTQDTSLRYDVTGIGGELIRGIDQHLYGGAATGNAQITITELATDINGVGLGNILGQIPPGSAQSLIFAAGPQSKITIHKDIGLAGHNGNAALSFFSNSVIVHPTSVPESSFNFGILVLGALGLGATIKRQQK